MSGSREHNWSILDLGKFLARQLRAVAAVLERRSAGRSGSDDQFERVMTALRRRYPDAPEHWLRFVAERTPGAGPAEPDSVDRRDARGAVSGRDAPLRLRSRAKQSMPFERREAAAPKVPTGKGPRASTARNADEANEVNAGPRRFGERTVNEAQQTVPVHNSIERASFPPERTPRFGRLATQVSLLRPRFRPQPSPQQHHRAPIEPALDAPARLARVVTNFFLPDKVRGADLRGDADWASGEQGRRAVPHIVSARTGERVPSKRSPMGGAKIRAARPSRARVQAVFVAPSASRSNAADQNRYSEAPDTTAAARRTGLANRSAQRAAMPASTERRWEVAIAPDEPKWPELPASPRILPDSERADALRVSTVREESDRWNGLPF